MKLVRRYLGDTVAGASIAAGLLIVAPEGLSWSWFMAVVVIVFGTSAGDALDRRQREREGRS